jgi:hypothetical protein
MRAPNDVRFDDTQLVRTGVGDAWMANVGSATCIAQVRMGGVTCDSVANFVKRGLSLGAFKPSPKGRAARPRDFVVIGLAPDWTQTVRMKVGSTTRRIPIRLNAYGLRAAEPITVKRLDGPAKTWP